MSGQSITDRITAAQHSVTGSAISKTVCKATTHEIMGPKKKHLDYLIQCTNEMNVNIPQLADTLFERTANTSWVVVFKSLTATHHLMVYGNERFIQYLASRNTLFNLNNFLDKSGLQGYDMSTFIRRYSRYLNEKAVSYRQVAFDFTKVKRGSDGVMRTMSTEKLLKTVPIIQNQMDVLLDFNVNANELTNGVINAAFMLLFKDAIRLFAAYNEGIINLLEKYFDMKKVQCKEGLDIYKKFLTRMTRISEFLKVAEQVGIDRGDIPDLSQAPSSLLDALEQHLASLEGKKVKDSTAASRASTLSSAVSSLANTGMSLTRVDEREKQAALEEEQARLKALKEQRLKELQRTPTTDSSPVSTVGGTINSAPVIDLFSTPSSTNRTGMECWEKGGAGDHPGGVEERRELKKAEEQRIRNLQKTVSDRGLLRYLTGEWFYETKQRRHRERIHSADIIRASMRQAQRPPTTHRPGGEENNTRLSTASSTDLPAHEEPQSPLVSSTKSWKERKRVRWSSTDAGGREGEEAEVDVDRIAPAEAEDGDLEKTVGLDPLARLQGAFQKELDGKNQELPEQEVARHQLLDGTSLISAVCVCVCDEYEMLS
ncbi:unnamed protein product [Tetraodon nigroviridis]|uniref:Phosphatidylinositol-binding clathrin assembly protein n=1 Tax=Tetraodon nigroviridis TaxID=99883 RepID=Q4SLA3_TETNG|nr:unnamed protein product [Tetraodon nigroviridis]